MLKVESMSVNSNFIFLGRGPGKGRQIITLHTNAKPQSRTTYTLFKDPPVTDTTNTLHDVSSFKLVFISVVARSRNFRCKRSFPCDLGEAASRKKCECNTGTTDRVK